MSKEVIVHAGYHKTGSSWLQRKYFPHLINTTFIDRRHYTDLFCNTNAFELDFGPLMNKIAAAPHDKVLLSLEELTGNMHNGGYNGFFSKLIADKLRESFQELKLIVFIRNQADMIVSCYQQYVKEGGTHSLQRYLFHGLENYRFRGPLFCFEFFNFHLLIDYYVKLFGRQNVFVYTYESFAKDNRTFIRAFEEDLHLESSMSEVDFEVLNTAISLRLLPIYRFVNLFFRGDVAYKNRLIRLPGKLDNRSHRMKLFVKLSRWRPLRSRKSYRESLGRSTEEYINRFYAESNRIMREKYDLGLVEHGYPGLSSDGAYL